MTKQSYTKVTQSYDWSAFIPQCDKFPEFVTQKELTEKKWPIPRLQSIIKPFQVARYLVYKTSELKEALQNAMLNPDTFVLHPEYMDINEISIMMKQSPHKTEIILNYYKRMPLFVHDQFHKVKIYDRKSISEWWKSSKHIVNKNIENIFSSQGIQLSVVPNDDKYLSDDLKKYKMTSTQAALYLGQTPGWLSNNRHDPLHRRIPFIRIGKLYRYAKEDLDFYIRSRTAFGATGPSLRRFIKN